MSEDEEQPGGASTMPLRGTPFRCSAIRHPDGHKLTEAELAAWGRSPRVVAAWASLLRAADEAALVGTRDGLERRRAM